MNFDLNLLNEMLGVDNVSLDEPEAEEQKKSVDTYKNNLRHFVRHVKRAELGKKPLEFEKGACYHFLSFGDIDALTYLRAIVKQQPLEYLFVSTWRVTIEDLEELKDWIVSGRIKRVDFYLGNNYLKKHHEIYTYILENCLVDNARVVIFKNHSKVMAGFGRDFDFSIAGSANLNHSTPQCEQVTVTIDSGLAKFYKNFYDDVKSLLPDCDDWQPYDLGDR